MAKLKKFAPETEFISDIESNYSASEMALIDDRKKFAQYDDSETGFQVVLLGTKFKYEGSHLVSGNVDEVQFCAPDGEKFASITDFVLSAKKIDAAILGDFGVNGLLADILKHRDVVLGTSGDDSLSGEAGNDTIKGKGGIDDIVGNRGNDTLFGGGGNDFYSYFGNDGHDVIKDFDLGHEGSFDTLYIRDIGFEIVKGAKNFVQFDFEDGSSVLLEGIKFADRSEVNVDAIL